MRARVLTIAMFLQQPLAASAQQAPAAQTTPGVAALTEEAEHLLAAGDRVGALVKLRQARAAVPPGSWLEPKIDELVHVAEREGRITVPAEYPSAASAEDLVGLYASLGIFGGWTGYWALHIEAETDGNTTGSVMLLTTGGGVAVAYLLDHTGEPLTGGTASAITFGLFAGTAESLLTVAALDKEVGGKELATIAWASGAAGGTVAGVVGSAAGATRGGMALVTAGTLWGGTLGALVAAAAKLPGPTVATAALGGSLTGMTFASVLAKQVAISRGRVLYIDVGGFAGGMAGLGFAAGARLQEPGEIAAAVAVTTGAGLIVATLLTAGIDDPPRIDSIGLGPMFVPSSRSAPAASGLALTGRF